jgi:hypothetical protein
MKIKAATMKEEIIWILVHSWLPIPKKRIISDPPFPPIKPCPVGNILQRITPEKKENKNVGRLNMSTIMFILLMPPILSKKLPR